MQLAELLDQALKAPDLAPPNGCHYVFNGKRCIVGTMLHLLGVSDSALLGPSSQMEYAVHTRNSLALAARTDLQEAFTRNGITDIDLIRNIQATWDGGAPEKHFVNNPLIKKTNDARVAKGVYSAVCDY